MAAQELVQFRVDGELKRETIAIFEQLGLDLPTACRMFLAKARQVRGIPFEMTLPHDKVTPDEAVSAFMRLREQASDAGVPEMTLDEINAEIADARKTINERHGAVQ